MRSSVSFRVLMIVALLFAQIGGVAHVYSHVLSGQSITKAQLPSADKTSSHEEHCDYCATFDQIASALASSIVSFTPFRNFDGLGPSHSYAYTSIASFPFAARAPPCSA
ncbi:MAG: hypothetical protein KKH12_11210 [Gammaproteobacteria bacterium]|nr:hypothetical protein [Gammaproteobacteria bacterium]MBU1482226.1 hypothetical protein [Gammaproteobacteria bacterium]